MDFSEDILRHCVQNIYSKIVVSFDPKGYILNNLFEKGTITMDEKLKIEELPERRRGAALVDMLYNCRRPNALARFVKILSKDTAYKWIAEEVLEAAERKVAFDQNLISSSGSESNSIQIDHGEEALQSKRSEPLSQTNIDSAKKQIRDNYTKMKKYLDPRYDLLDLLYEKDILTHEKHKYIRRLVNPEECCGELLDHLLDKEDIEQSLAVFKDVLRTNHLWVYNMIWRDPNDDKDEDNRPLSDDERCSIIFNTTCLVKLIDPYKHDFLPYLTGKGCITLSHFESLSSLGRVDKREMVSELFRILLRRSFVHYQIFIHWLKYTLQHNIVQILESNGVVMNVEVDLKNNKLEKHLADILTGTVKLDHLDLGAKDRKVVENIMRTLEEKGLVIVGGACGSLIVYILCLSLNAVNEMEKLYTTKELETTLNIVMNATIRINDDEFTRCRRFFRENICFKRFKSDADHRAFHCFTGGKLNDMPLVIFDVILKRTSWMMWVCFLIKSLQPCSLMHLTEYLKDGIQGFYNFVKVSAIYIYREISSVCSVWRRLLKNYGKSLKSNLLWSISRTAIDRSAMVLFKSLRVQDGLLNLSLNEKLITMDEKDDCESNPDKANETFISCLYRNKRRTFAKLLKFLSLLEKQYKTHLANHVIGFGVHWPNFEKKWPLNMKSKLRISNAFFGKDLVLSMEIEDDVDCWKNKLGKGDISPALEIEHTETSYRRDGLSQDLISLLFENKCITAEERNELNQLERKGKQRKLLKLMEHGSVEMYEIVIDYLERTGQHEVVHMLQPNQEVQKYGKYIVICLNRATDFLNSMYEENEITSSLLDNFPVKIHPLHSGNSKAFQHNDVVLNILECSGQNLYILFLTFLMATEQHELLLPVFESIPHSKLIENFESYMLDSIDVESDLLFELHRSHVINSAQKRTIELKRTLKGRNKELLNIISKTSPKSFNLFLTALVRTGRSKLTEKMSFTNSTLEAPTVNENRNIAAKQVAAKVKTNHENSSIEILMSTNIEHDKSRTQEIISSDAKSEEMLQPFRNEEYAEIEYKLEDKERFALQLKTIESLSNMIYDVIKHQASLPTDIQNLLFLKMIAMNRDPLIDLHNLSRHFQLLLGYLSGIRDQEVQFTHLTEELSLSIDSEEITRMDERKHESKLKSKVKFSHQTLIECIDPSLYISKTLVTEGVLTSHQMAEVNSMPSSEIRAKELLSILSNSEHPKAFSIFRKALQRDNAKMVQMIDETEFHSDDEHDAMKQHGKYPLMTQLIYSFSFLFRSYINVI